MKRDDPPLANDGNFDQVVPQGTASRVFAYLSASVELLAGPALIVILDLAGELAWQGVLGGVVTTVIVGGMGAMTWISTVRNKRRADRLARNGHPATALVVDSTDRTLGEQSGTELTLRVSGPRVPEFLTTHRTTKQVPAVGQGFAVIVDPADNVFMIVR